MFRSEKQKVEERSWVTSCRMSKVFSGLTRETESSDKTNFVYLSGVPRGGVQPPQPPHKIPRALQNRAKLNPIVKTVKNN